MSAVVRVGYKQTEVGVIPEEWSVKKIGELCTYQNGTSLERFFNRRDGFKVVSIGNYGVSGSYVENGNFIGFEYRKAVEKFILRLDDLTMSLNDKTAVGAIIGRVLLIEKSEAYVFNQRTMRLTPNDGALPAYLHHAINSDQVHSAIVGLAKPGTQIYVNTNDIIDLKISVPPVPEQHAIATALSDVDALLAKLDALIAKKRDLKVATMQQLLTGQTRLPGFSGEWEVKRLGDLIDVIADFTANGSFESLKNNVRYYDRRNFAVLVRTTDLDKPQFVPERFTDEIGYKFLSKTALFGGELVIANVGSIGKVFRVPAFDLPMTLAPNTYLLKINKCTDETYLFHWMKTSEFYMKLMSKIGSSTLQAINKDNLRSIEFSLPCEIREQTTIATVLSDMDTELTTLEARRDKTRAIKQGMMQELLTGRIRLV